MLKIVYFCNFFGKNKTTMTGLITITMDLKCDNVG